MEQKGKKGIYLYERTRYLRCHAQVHALTHRIISGECPRIRAHHFILEQKETLGHRFVYGAIYPRGGNTGGEGMCTGQCIKSKGDDPRVAARVVFYTAAR